MNRAIAAIVGSIALAMAGICPAKAQPTGCRTATLAGQALTNYCASEAYVSRHFPASSTAGHVVTFGDSSGQVLVDGGPTTSVSISGGQGVAVSPDPITGTGTVSTSSAVETNTLRSMTLSGNILPTDCGKLVYVTGYISVTLPSVSGFAADCVVTVQNGNPRTAGNRAQLLSGFPITMTSSSKLYPGQIVHLKIVSGVWTSDDPGRWKVPNNTQMEVDVVNGNDANDCLAPGAGNACKTMTQAIRVNAKDHFDLSGTSAYPTANLVVHLADNGAGGNCFSSTQCYSLVDIAFSLTGIEGRNGLLIKGNSTTPSNVVIADASAYGINVFRTSVEIQDLQFGQTNCALSPKANSGLSILEGGVVFLQGTVIFGCVAQQQIVAFNGGRLDSNGRPISVVAGGGWFAYADFSSYITLSGTAGASTVTFSNSPAYSQQVINTSRLSFVAAGGVTWTNGGTVSGTKYNCVAATIEGSAGVPGTGTSTSNCTAY